MMLPDPSSWREQDWEEMLPLENGEVMETVKTLTQYHKAKGWPSHKTDWVREKEGKVQNTGASYIQGCGCGLHRGRMEETEL
ncbi:zinc finger protein 343 isoform X2 [Kogia breviceps]|uniref:zinc finger protein 343 isoform X2 n=1 Tax=Kogia breviceps TaxID=27615 RepID=UPI0034D15B0C